MSYWTCTCSERQRLGRWSKWPGRRWAGYQHRNVADREKGVGKHIVFIHRKLLPCTKNSQHSKSTLQYFTDVYSVLTHFDCSIKISMRTLASSFLLTKPISSSASSASTSTTGRGSASVSRNCVSVCRKIQFLIISRRFMKNHRLSI